MPSFRSAVRTLASLLTATVAIGCDNPPSFERAQRDDGLRQPYLDSVAKKAHLPDYVTGIEYRTVDELHRLLPETRGLDPLPGMLTVRDDLGKVAPVGGGVRSRIIVLPPAFDPSQVESETVFLLGLLDHERVHAWVNWFGFEDPALGPDVLGSLPEPGPQWLYATASELVAHREEIKAAMRYQLPAIYWRKAYGAYLMSYVRVFKAPVQLPETLRDHLLVEYFQPWMTSLESLVRDDERWRFVLGGEAYELPLPVVQRIERALSAR